MKKRKDGRYRTSLTINGNIEYFYGHTAKEAKELKADFKRYEHLPKENPKSQILFEQITREWLTFHQATVKKSTHNMYYSKAKFILNDFGNIPLSKISSYDIQIFLNSLADKNLSKSTVSKYKLTLSQIFNYAEKLQLIQQNPCRLTDLPKSLTSQKRRTLTENEIETINKSVDIPFGLYPFVLLYLGLRRSECLALKWSDFDFNNNTVCISRVAIFDGNTPRIDHVLKNGDAERVVPIPQILKNVLLGRQGSSPSEWVFHNEDGELYTAWQLRRKFDEYLKATNLTFTQHMTRHAYATMLYNAGVDVKVAQRFLGHKTLAMTLEIYTHLDSSHISSGAEQLNTYLGSKGFK